MNWLAHIFISKKSVDYQLGNLLADPLKGKCWTGANSLVQEGFKMHGSIDAFTDSNEHVKRSKSRLGEKGYLKGVIVDIAYDHLLLQNWEQYAKIDTTSFINEFYHKSEFEIASYPNDAREFVQRLIKSRTLTSYSSFEGLEEAFRRIDNRLSKRILAKETASGYMPILKREMNAIEDDFLFFFPQLVAHFKSKSDLVMQNHWLK